MSRQRRLAAIRHLRYRHKEAHLSTAAANVDNKFRHVAEPNTILRCVVGSSVHGIAIEGTDDRDEMGVCIEPPEYVLGLERFEQWVYRTQPEGHRSQAGDLDLTIFSLRKWAKLAVGGTPTILLLLFAPPLIATPLGERLQANAHLFASRRAGRRFLGYLESQRQRLGGERGGNHGKARPELVAQFGYDVKYAGHMVRLGFQGVEYLETGRLTLPMPEEARERCRAIRTGGVSKEASLALARELEARLSDLLTTSPLPEEPDYAAVDRFLIDAYTEHWREHGLL